MPFSLRRGLHPLSALHGIGGPGWAHLNTAPSRMPPQKDDMADLRRRFEDADDERMRLAGEVRCVGL